MWLLLARLFAPSLEQLLGVVVSAATNTQQTSTAKAADLTTLATDLLSQASDHTAKANKASDIVTRLTDLIG